VARWASGLDPPRNICSSSKATESMRCAKMILADTLAAAKRRWRSAARTNDDDSLAYSSAEGLSETIVFSIRPLHEFLPELQRKARWISPGSQSAGEKIIHPRARTA